MKDAAFFNRRGIDFLQAGQFKEAIQCFNQAIGLDPASPDAYHNLGEAYTRLGKSVAPPAAASRRQGAAQHDKTTGADNAAPEENPAEDLYYDLLSVILNAFDNVWDELF